MAFQAPYAFTQAEATILKLRGAGDYEVWAQCIEAALRSKDHSYWDIVQGRIQVPKMPERSHFSDETIRAIVARERYIAEHDVSQEDIATFEEDICRRHLDLLIRWSGETGDLGDKCVDINILILNTIDDAPYECVRYTETIPDMWNTLKALYAPCPSLERRVHIANLRVTKYLENDSRASFIHRFKGRIAAFRAVVEVDPWLEYSLFMKALYVVPDLQPFVAQMYPNYKETDPDMAEVYSAFCNYKV